MADVTPLDVVFEQQPAPRRFPVAWVVALAAHGVILILANRAQPSLETWSARVGALIHEDLTAKAPVTIEEAPLPKVEVKEAPPPEPEPEPVQPVARAPAKTSPAPVAPPAQAAEVVAAPAPEGPVDFTDNTFVTGTAKSYVGGATAANGTGTEVVKKSDVGTEPAAPSRASPVQLPAGAWQCGWPSTALAEDIYEQAVVLRVTVGADGRVERASVINDPGHGFGAAAEDCARRTRFLPARDVVGNAVKAESPPIRVRFTR